MQQRPLFIYGSLMDKDILSCVLGRTLDETMIGPARLANHSTHTYPNESFPLLKISKGNFAYGEVVYGLSDTDIDRINFYEGDEYGFGEPEVEIADGSLVKAIYNCSEPLDVSTPEWNLAAWQQDEKPSFIHMCRHYMSLYGTMSIDDADIIWQKLVKDDQLSRRSQNTANRPEHNLPLSESPEENL